MRPQVVMAGRARNHPYRLGTRELHAQSEGIRVVLPPSQTGKGTTRVKVQGLPHPTHTHSPTRCNQHITDRCHLPTTPTCPFPAARQHKNQSGSAIGNTIRAEHASRGAEVSNPSGQGVRRQVHTKAHAMGGQHKACTHQKPQGVRKVIACLRVPPRGSAASAIKSP